MYTSVNVKDTQVKTTCWVILIRALWRLTAQFSQYVVYLRNRIPGQSMRHCVRC